MPKSDSEAPVIQTIKKEESVEVEVDKNDESIEEPSNDELKQETSEGENQSEAPELIEEKVSDEEKIDNDVSNEEEK
jgi:hypothetical protein